MDQPGHDLDLYVFYCPNFSCSQVGSSATGTSTEKVKVQFPVNDPTIDDPYAVIVHGYNTVGGAPANGIYFNWTIVDPNGTLAVSPPSVSAVAGQSATLNVNWSGLFSGTGAKFIGDVSHSSDSGIQGLTTVTVENDAGVGYADLCELIGCT